MFHKLLCKHNFVISRMPEIHNGQLVTDIICTKCGRRHDMQRVRNNKFLEKEKVSYYE